MSHAVHMITRDDEERIPTGPLEKDTPTGPLESDPVTLADPAAFVTERGEEPVGENTCLMLELDF